MLYITNAFSLNMLPSGKHVEVSISPVIPGELYFEDVAEGVNAFGHKDVAEIAATELAKAGLYCPPYTDGQRPSVSLKHGDQILVLQYRGPRLPEGASILPQGASLTWTMVQVKVLSRPCQCGSGQEWVSCSEGGPFCG